MTNKTVLTEGKIARIGAQIDVCYEPSKFRAEFARAIEQALLQSPEIQQLRKDALSGIAAKRNPHIGHDALADAWQRGFDGAGYGWSRLPLDEYKAVYAQGEQCRAIVEGL